MAEQQNERNRSKLPIAKNEDVEYSAELADMDDVEAQERADRADARQEGL